MLKKSLVATAVFLGLAGHALASDVRCEPPVLNVSGDSGVAQYTVACRGDARDALVPAVSFSGEMPAHGTAPYAVKANYTIDVRPVYAQALDIPARADQKATGSLASSTVSLAALPTQFSQQVAWDAETGVFSVEEKAGLWRVFSVRFDEADGAAYLVDAGYAGEPMTNGRATARVVLGAAYSRFAGKGSGAEPLIKAELGLRDGLLEVLVGETRVANQDELQAALMSLDKQPKDISRAWAFAARAKFLGLDNEVRYAEQKVAAHNPQLLEEFQRGLDNIEPYALNQD